MESLVESSLASGVHTLTDSRALTREEHYACIKSLRTADGHWWESRNKLLDNDAAQREEIERLRDRLKETMEMCHDAISRRVSIQEQAKYGARMGAIRAEEF